MNKDKRITPGITEYLPPTKFGYNDPIKTKAECKIKEEIINSSIEIEKKLNIKVKHFAYSYGDINSFNQKSFNIAKSKFEYIFSGVRGNNSNLRFDKNIIRRDSIEPSFTINLINFFLEGFIDFKYNMENQKLDKWTN